MRLVPAGLLLLAVGCGGASPSSGVTALLRVQGAQLVPGEISTAPGAPMPEMHTVGSNNSRLYPGVASKAINGTVGPGGVAVQVGLQGDSVYWIAPVEDPDLNTPGDFTFNLRVAFSSRLPTGPVALVFRAVGADGAVGPPKVQMLSLDPQAETAPLRITLRWDTEADLDLRVRAPATNGGAPVEIGPQKGSSLNPPKPGDPDLGPEDLAGAARLDFDSNAQCLIDGHREETIFWPKDPAPGRYEVRVDAFSLCGEEAARWKLTISQGGTTIDERFGQAGEADTRRTHGAGAGLLVTFFDIGNK